MKRRLHIGVHPREDSYTAALQALQRAIWAENVPLALALATERSRGNSYACAHRFRDRRSQK